MKIATTDYRLLKLLIDSCMWRENGALPSLASLENMLLDASQVEPEEVSNDVVTMNSIVVLRELSSGLKLHFALAYPWEANQRENRLSVLSPIGLISLGHTVGDILVYRRARRVYQFRIEKIIFQPETELSRN